jgi:tRNA (mo5U34)-methyltransferase
MNDFQDDYLEKFPLSINAERIRELRAEPFPKKYAGKFSFLQEVIANLPNFKSRLVDYDGDVVRIGDPGELSADQKVAVETALKDLMPWKKGPFCLFGHEIDAEWRSDIKWRRLLPKITPMAGRRVADIGCNNGYYMYRMAAQNPELVVGFEPMLKNYFEFEVLQRYAQVPNLYFERFGVEHIDLYQSFFDTVFCMGILYHHQDPLGILKKIRHSMAPGAQLIIDCQGIAGNEPVALLPKNKYTAGVGFWFLPTISCLEHWVSRTGFRNIEIFYTDYLTSHEQRATKWAPIKSLDDFLDPNDKTRTVEGYPAPMRFYLTAMK